MNQLALVLLVIVLLVTIAVVLAWRRFGLHGLINCFASNEEKAVLTDSEMASNTSCVLSSKHTTKRFLF